MRALLALIFLASCSQPTPQAELGGAISLADMTYHCTPEGNEFVRFEYEEGSEDRVTGRRCDYEAWRADVAANGPIHSRNQLQTLDEWRASQ